MCRWLYDDMVRGLALRWKSPGEMVGVTQAAAGDGGGAAAVADGAGASLLSCDGTSVFRWEKTWRGV